MRKEVESTGRMIRPEVHMPDTGCDKSQSNVEARLHELEQSLKYAESVAAGLRNKLASVMKPAETGSSGQPGVPMPVQSPLCETLTMFASDVQHITSILNDITARVEL